MRTMSLHMFHGSHPRMQATMESKWNLNVIYFCVKGTQCAPIDGGHSPKGGGAWPHNTFWMLWKTSDFVVVTMTTRQQVPVSLIIQHSHFCSSVGPWFLTFIKQKNACKISGCIIYGKNFGLVDCIGESQSNNIKWHTHDTLHTQTHTHTHTHTHMHAHRTMEAYM